MIKKVKYIFAVLLLLLTVVYFLELAGVTEMLVKSNNIKINFVIYMIISVSFFLLLFFVTLIPEIKIVEKIVYKDSAKEEAAIEETLLQKNENKIQSIIQEITDNLLTPIKQETQLSEFCDKMLIAMSKRFNFVQSVFFVLDKNDNKYKTCGTYAFYSDEVYREFELGEGLTGQVAKDKKLIILKNIPEKYITIVSGLGKGAPCNLIILPIVKNNQTLAIMEFAAFEKIDDMTSTIFSQIAMPIADEITKYI